MKNLREQIPTWISIGALLVSLGAFYETQRKQSFDERTYQAKQSATIKAKLGDSLRAMDKLLSYLAEYDESLKRLAAKENAVDENLGRDCLKMKSQVDDIMAIMKARQARTKKMYDILGHGLAATDPVALESFSVDAENLVKDLDEEREWVQTLVRNMPDLLERVEKLIRLKSNQVSGDPKADQPPQDNKPAAGQ